MATICGVVCNCGRWGEPIACGYAEGHDGAHSWGSLPTFVGGEPEYVDGSVVQRAGWWSALRERVTQGDVPFPQTFARVMCEVAGFGEPPSEGDAAGGRAPARR